MATEKQLEKQFRTHCPGITHKLSCLNQPGVPDRLVLLPSGRVSWVELKAMQKWPPRVFRPGITPNQAVFLCQWEQGGGRAWLLVQVARDYLLFSPSTARALVKGLPVDEAISHARRVWYNESPWGDLWRLI